MFSPHLRQDFQKLEDKYRVNKQFSDMYVKFVFSGILKELLDQMDGMDEKMLSINENVKHYHEDFNGGVAMSSDTPLPVVSADNTGSSANSLDALKSYYGSIAED